MAFLFEQTEIPGLTLIHPHTSEDERGLYYKYYERNIYAKNGLLLDFGESSDIYSQKGALRGLHFQIAESQGKLLHVTQGSIYDVAVDLRKNSSTFGKWKSFRLSANQLVVYVPEGFAHGFLALENNTVFSYQCTGRYRPDAMGGIRWDDPELGIPWPVDEVGQLILSEKDRRLPVLSEIRNEVPH